MNKSILPILLAALPLFWHQNQTCAQPAPKPPATRAVAAKDLKSSDLKELDIPNLRPLFIGPPLRLRVEGKDIFPHPRGGLLVPRDVGNISRDKPVMLSDKEPVMGDAKQVTDGNCEGVDGNCVELAAGPQWAQIDLQKEYEIWAIAIWHYYAEPRVYLDVIVQVSSDPKFEKDVITLFNNDTDNSSGRGKGLHQPYLETPEGLLVDGRAIKARYVRCYSNGNTANLQNHYVEIEVHGRPPK